MTEKRFTTVELPKPNRWGIWYDGAYLSTYQVCILLNEYVDVKKENEQLKSRVEYLERKIDRERTSYQKQHEKWEEEIQKENEQLKKDCTVLICHNQDYRKENEQLKKELFEARKDYLIETADISDKLYLDEIIEKERKEIFE